MNTTYFALEQHIIDRLSAIDGLAVKTTADVSETTLKTITKPTAVVAYVSDEVTSDAGVALQLEQNWNVFLVCRGATRDRGAADGELLLKIVAALHNWSPSGDYSELKLQGVESDYLDNARQYLAAFKTRTVLRIA